MDGRRKDFQRTYGAHITQCPGTYTYITSRTTGIMIHILDKYIYMIVCIGIGPIVYIVVIRCIQHQSGSERIAQYINILH
ncbi:hypothetical protein D3C80_1316370 [compost metagenome]